MKYLTQLILSTVFLLSAMSACTQTFQGANPDEQPLMPSNGAISVNWYSPLVDSFDVHIQLNGPKVYKNLVLMSHDSDTPIITAFDTDTGINLWDFSCTDCAYTLGNSPTQTAIDTTSGIYVALTGKEVFAFKIESQEFLWSLDLRRLGYDPYVEVVIHNSNSYLAVTKDRLTDLHRCSILEINNETGSFSEVVTIDDKSEDFPNELISVPSFWSDRLSGESLMLVSVGHGRIGSPRNNPQSIIAFDANTYDTVWYHNRFSPEFGGQGLPPYVIDNELYLLSDWSVHRIDVRTGEFIWTTVPDERDSLNQWVAHSQPLVDEDKVFVNPVSPEVYALSRETGEIIWENEFAAATSSPYMHIYNSVLLVKSFGLASIVALDKVSGVEQDRMRGYMNFNYTYTPFAYDWRTDQFFADVAGGVVALKISIK